MFRRFPRPPILRYLKNLGAGRVLAGALVALVLGGPTLGALAAADAGGFRSAVTDAIRLNSSDEDDVLDDGTEPTPDGGPDTGDSPDSPDTGDSPDSPDTGDSPDSPDTGDSPDSPDTGDSPDSPDTGDSPDSPDTGDSPESE